MTCSNDVEKNLSKAIEKIEHVAAQGAQIICLQELFKSLYFCQAENNDHFDLAEKIPGPTTDKFQDLAKKLHVVIVASLFEKRTTGVYHNTTVVIDADGVYLGKYRKMHIPDDPCYLEKYYFTPGDLGYQVFKTKFAKVGVLICWDQWYPEAARLTALKGADIIVYPTAIGWVHTEEETERSKQLAAWKGVQTGHAIANEVFVVTPNRVGEEGNITFWGNSFVVDPFGETLYQASSDTEEAQVVTCDLNRVEEYRRAWPFFRDRRIGSYGAISKRVDD
ncbi:carbon-nitrogen hydrolase [bacterium]|nr:carbon-nitrogen hydrolase [bacterium]MBU1916563.1 carbon-nitrogen hydrolase [bacterium]